MQVNRHKLSKILECSKQCVLTAVKVGNLILNESGLIDTDDLNNTVFLEKWKFKDKIKSFQAKPKETKNIIKNNKTIEKDLSKWTIESLEDDDSFKNAPLTVWRIREDLLQKRERRLSLKLLNAEKRGELIPKKYFSYLTGYINELSNRLFDLADSFSTTIISNARSIKDDTALRMKIKTELLDSFSVYIKEAKQRIKNKINNDFNNQKKENIQTDIENKKNK